jgi:hypothetical protein
MKLNKEKAQLLSELIKNPAVDGGQIMGIAYNKISTGNCRVVIHDQYEDSVILSIRPAYDFNNKGNTEWAQVSLENNKFIVKRNSGLTKQAIKKCISILIRRINALSDQVIQDSI